MERNYRCILGLGLAICRGKAQAINAAHNPSYDRIWSKINQYSPVEGFESHGSYGWHLGVGFLVLPKPPSLDSPEVENASEIGQDRIGQTELPRLFLTHGTSLPLDFGLSLAHSNSNSNLGSQIGGHLQWTFFEGFQKPAIALRMSRIETRGISGLDQLQTDNLILGMSYGFWRYFSFGIGFGQQLIKFKAKAEKTEALLGLRSNSDLNLTESKSILCANFKTDLLAPFLKLGLERIYVQQAENISLIKISYML